MPDMNTGTTPMSVWHSMRIRALYPFVLGYFAGIPREQRAGLRVLDVPAGTGVLSVPLAAAGFDVTPADLFPETFDNFAARTRGQPVSQAFAHLTKGAFPPALRQGLFGDPAADPLCQTQARGVAADMEKPLPFADGSFDIALCVEGIEHVVDRHRTLSELRRVLRPGGRLLITTPNLLSLRGRVSYALTGQRAFKSHIDEYTSVWGVSDDGLRTYHGHAFLISYYQLRYSLRHCGFRLVRPLRSNWSPSSLLLSPLIPLVALATLMSQRRARKAYERMGPAGRLPKGAENPFRQITRHVLSPALLFNSTLMLEAEAVDRSPLVNPAEGKP